MLKVLTDATIIVRIYLLAMQRAAVLYLVVFTLFPLSFLFFAKYIVPEGVPVGSRLITGSIVFSLGITIVNDLSQSLLNERFNFHLKLIVVSPVRKVSYAAGIVVSGLVRALPSALVLILCAPLFGLHIHLSLWLVPLTLLSALSLTGIALVIGTWAPGPQIGNLLANTVGILAVLFSPIYYPLSRLPDWLQWPARLSPYTYAGSAIDGVLSGAGGFYDEMGILAALTAVCLILGFQGMRWRDV